MEPRSFYDITEAEDRKELAQLIKTGVFGYAVLIPEDLPAGEIEAVFREAGLREVAVDASRWPRQVVVRTEAGVYVFKKVEEGVYRLSKED